MIGKETDTDKPLWVDIKGYEGYYKININGDVVRNTSTYHRIKNPLVAERLMTKYLTTSGYITVGLCRDGKPKRFMLHRLIAIAFIPNPKNLPHINHINNDSGDYSISNLEWVSNRENLSHGRKFHKKTSKYTGVFLKKDTGRWRAFIRVNKKGIWLGDYKNELDASKAYKAALKEYNLKNKYA